jgi:hypothetical protein
LSKKPISNELNEAIKAQGNPIATSVTAHEITKLTDSVMLPALWKIRFYNKYIQGMKSVWYNIQTVGTSPVETINNLFGTQKPRFTSRLSFDIVLF